MSITKLRGKSSPTRIIAFDTETIPERRWISEPVEQHTLRLGVAKFCRMRHGSAGSVDTLKFYTTDQFCDWLDSKLVRKQTTWIIAHNAGFDAQVAGILSGIKRGRYRFTTRGGDNPPPEPDSIWAPDQARWFIIADPPTILNLEDAAGRRFTVMDTMNFVPRALAEMGRRIGLEKLPMPAWDAPDEEWATYCERDVDIVLEWFLGLVDFIRTNRLGSVKWTASSQAMTAYRTRFLPRDIETHRIEEVRTFEREAYFGGEVRVFRQGEIPCDVSQVDVNSLFPSVMAAREYPVRLDRWNWDSEWHRPPAPYKPADSIAEVFLSTADDDYLSRQGGQPCPTVGYFATILAGDELLAAHERGHVLAYRRWAQYETADLFGDWVQEMYALRQRCRAMGREDWAHLCKLLLNSLYGKFAQRGSDLLWCPDVRAPIPYGTHIEIRPSDGMRNEYLVVAGDCYQRIRRGELESAFPPISIFVAAAARRRMEKLRAIVGPYDLVYQAIDSLIVTDAGLGHLTDAGEIDPAALGKLKIQHQAQRVRIHGHGWYQIGEKHVLPGRKRTATEDVPGGYSQLMFSGLSTSLFGPDDDIVWGQRRHIAFPTGKARGTVDMDGWVRPIYVAEEFPL